MAFALASASVRGRNVFAVIGIFCLVASSLPMSRGAMVDAMVSCGALLKAYGIRSGRVWLLAGVIAISAVLLVPDAIWSRMVFMQPEVLEEKRFSLYTSAWENVEDFLYMGIGAGNFSTKWGIEHGFGIKRDRETIVIPAHNVFVQVVDFLGADRSLTVSRHNLACIPLFAAYISR